MLDNGLWSKQNEKFVLDVRDFLITDCLVFGYNVIVDDTNLHPKHEQRIREIASLLATQGNEVSVEIKDFTDVPVQTCILNDAKRTVGYVGEKVIIDMYNKFIRKEEKEPDFNEYLPTAVICDLDGTLALLNGRDPYDPVTVEEDTVRRSVSASISALGNDGYIVILVSGRKEKYREQTLRWLRKNGIMFDLLYMRQTDDNRKDSIVKEEIYNENIKDLFNVLCVFDDRNQVVAFWRSIGLPCFQVADGNF